MNKDEKAKAVAVKYKKDAVAPNLTAKGKGEIAERIIKLAQDNGVPLHKDADLVEVLSLLDVNELIPPALYQVVAEVLAFVYQLNQERKQEIC